MSLNKVILIGNAGNDPEVTHIDSGSVVANFSLATNETYKDKTGEKKTVTEWHRCVAWGKNAEVIEEYVKTGQLLYIEGRIKTRSYEDKDKATKYITEVFVSSFKMLGAKRDGEPNQAKVEAQVEAIDEIPPLADKGDLPF